MSAHIDFRPDDISAFCRGQITYCTQVSGWILSAIRVQTLPPTAMPCGPVRGLGTGWADHDKPLAHSQERGP